MSTQFRLLKQFEQPEEARALERRVRIRAGHASRFPGEDLASAFARALCEERATSLKELLEAFEFFQTVRKFVTRPHMVDVCSGHGLVGTLFALFERKVETVTLVDRLLPPSFERIMKAADRIGPWTREKLVFREGLLKNAQEKLSTGNLHPGSAILAVHACGKLTDQAMDLAIDLGGPMALLPCCRSHRQHPAPEVLKRELGGDLAIDVHRTYALEHAGYKVRWKSIPEVITPMNRILIGTPVE